MPVARATAVGSSIPAPGTLIAGKYEIVRLIGQGGMGVVYEAQHKRLDHRVAIKMLNEDVRHVADIVRRFDQEARAAVQLHSPHVARVHDVDSLEDGTPFIVMEYLDGHDLADEIAARGRIPAAEAVFYLLDACEAMTEAHALGIIHRDLKPANLFLSRGAEGTTVKVLDFGISKLSKTQNLVVTGSQSIFGSPHYMSPEQVRSAAQVDARSDLWSLGVILYEMLSGELPFQGESASGIIAAIIADAPRPLGERCPELPPALASAVMKTLNPDPAQRFGSVAEFAKAIAPFRAPARTMSFEISPRESGVSRSAPTLPAPREERALAPVPAPLNALAVPTSREHKKSVPWLGISIAAILVAGLLAFFVKTGRGPSVAESALPTDSSAASREAAGGLADSTTARGPTVDVGSANTSAAVASAAAPSATAVIEARGPSPVAIHDGVRAPAAPTSTAALDPAPAPSSGRRKFRTSF